MCLGIFFRNRARILVQVTIYRRLLIGRDGHLDQSEAYDISSLVREYGPRCLKHFMFSLYQERYFPLATEKSVPLAREKELPSGRCCIKQILLYLKLVQWLKLLQRVFAWKVGDRGFEPHSGLQVVKKQNVFYPVTHKDSI